MIDDKALVAQVLGGDTQAFRVLIKSHERLVSHMIGRLIDRKEDREELCQDVFLKVYEKLNEFTFQSKLSTWIATIAYRHGINHLRKHRIEIQELRESEDIRERFISSDNVEENIADQQVDNMVLQMIEKLPLQYRAILTLYHVQEMSYPEIVEITGLPEGTVKNYLFRARQLLKEKVKKYLGKEELI
jgi:RNA polymerase sigma-70 factor (ECF subfamily)